MSKIASVEVLKNLIYYREVYEVELIMSTLAKKVMEEGKPFYDVWMYEVSDNIQATGAGFAERFILESAISEAQKVREPKARKLVDTMLLLHCLYYMKTNMGWYLARGLISVEGCDDIENTFQATVRDLVPHLNTILESFNMPMKANLYPPIVRDFVKFNEQEDNENPDAAGPIWRPRMWVVIILETLIIILFPQRSGFVQQ